MLRYDTRPMVGPAPTPPRLVHPQDADRDGLQIGPYRLLRQLGQGGAAPVWLAEERFEGKKLRDVAIKLFLVPEPIAPTMKIGPCWAAGLWAVGSGEDSVVSTGARKP